MFKYDIDSLLEQINPYKYSEQVFKSLKVRNFYKAFADKSINIIQRATRLGQDYDATSNKQEQIECLKKYIKILHEAVMVLQSI